MTWVIFFFNLFVAAVCVCIFLPLSILSVGSAVLVQGTAVAWGTGSFLFPAVPPQGVALVPMGPRGTLAATCQFWARAEEGGHAPSPILWHALELAHSPSTYITGLAAQESGNEFFILSSHGPK